MTECMRRRACATLPVGELLSHSAALLDCTGGRALLFADALSASSQKEAGSFLRPTAPGLSYGVSLRSALHAKYLDDGSEQLRDEGSTFYATSSNFEVEVVPLSKVRDRFKQLSKLREVGLEWEGVNGAGTTDERAEVAKELAGECRCPVSCFMLY